MTLLGASFRRLRWSASLLVLMTLFAAPAAFASVVDLVNEVRSVHCGRQSVTGPDLRQDESLDVAALRLADGESLETAIRASGYRAKRSASIRVSAPEGEAQLARTLAKRFCSILADPALTEIGVYRRGAVHWMVLGARLSPPAEAAAAVAERVIELVNEARSERRRCGRRTMSPAPPLNFAAELADAAAAHARDMAAASFMGHRGTDGSLPEDRVSARGYAWASVAENVAAGQTTAAEVVGTWLESPPHCETLMSAAYTETGAALAANPEDERGIYWVQVFADPR